METVKILRKLLDLNLEELSISKSADNLESINNNSKKLNNFLKPCLTSSANNSLEQFQSYNNPDQNNYEQISTTDLQTRKSNQIITRGENAEKIRAVSKQNFLKKGEGLKRFNLTKNYHNKIINKIPVNKPKSRKILSLIKETNEKIVNPVEDNLTREKDLETKKNPGKENTEEHQGDSDSDQDETKERIFVLEKRLTNLKTLRNLIIQLIEIEDCKEKSLETSGQIKSALEEVKKNLSDMNGRLQDILNSSTNNNNNNKNVQINEEDNKKDAQKNVDDQNQPTINQRIDEQNKKERCLTKLLPDGTLYSISLNGNVEKLRYPNGDVEVRTDTYIKIKYANGNLKTIYANGFKEILHNDGRLQFINAHNEIVFDQIINI